MSLLRHHEDGDDEVHGEPVEHDASPEEAVMRVGKSTSWTSIHAIRSPASNTQGTRQHSWTNWYSTWWVPEILAWIGAVLCLVAICIILDAYNDQPLPNWHHGITLNTIVALLSTVCKMLLLIPVSEGLSQIKWLWYKKKHNASGENLMDFQDIDKASRGAFGSLPLVWKARYWPLASTGAVLMIIALGIAPVTQQALTYETRLRNSSTSASTLSPRATTYSDFDINNRGPAGRYGVSMAMAAAISSGLFHDSASTLASLTPSCPTGNCTWPEYESLGICAEIADISDLLTTSETSVGFNQSLPNGLYVFAPAGEAITLFVASANTSVPTIAFPNITLPVADFFVIASPAAPGSGTKGSFVLEVSLFFCVQTLSTATTNGLSTTTLAKWDDFFQRDSDTNYFNYTAKPTGQDETFLVTQAGAGYIQGFLATEFSGAYSRSPDGAGGIYDTDAIRAFVNARNTGPYDQLALEYLIGNLATSMSNAVRAFNSTDSPAIGQAAESTTFVRVEWAWLSLLGFLVAMSFIFLSAVVLLTSRRKVAVWKSSSIVPLLVFQRPDEYTDLTGLNNVEDFAGRTSVTLVHEGETWRLETVPSAASGLEYVGRSKHPQMQT